MHYLEFLASALQLHHILSFSIKAHGFDYLLKQIIQPTDVNMGFRYEPT